MFLLDRALVGGLKFVFGKIAQVAEQEADEEPALRERLLEAQLQLEQGTLDDAAYEAIETEVLQRLRRLKEDRIAAAKAARAGDDGDERGNETDGRQTITVEAVELAFDDTRSREDEEPADDEGHEAAAARPHDGARPKRAAARPKKRAAPKRAAAGKQEGAGSPKRAAAGKKEGAASPKRGARAPKRAR